MREKKKLTDILKARKIKKDQIVILFLTGVLLLVIALPERKTGQEDTAEFDAGETDTALSEDMTEREYVSYMERHLEGILSQMKGVGDVTVMITLK